MTEIENYSAGNSSVKQIMAFAILVLLVALSFSHPVVFGSTIDLSLYSAIPPVFWFALTYGLVLPFVTKCIRSPRVFKLWGTLVWSLCWSYFTFVEPELRYPDAYGHSRTTLLLAAQGVAPSVDKYLLWPNSFILQDITSQITGLPVLAISRILAVILVGLIGLLLMNIFSLFFEDHRKALLCLFATFMIPNTLMLTTQHYSPQLVAYVIALLVLFVLYKETTKQTGASSVLILLLVTIVLSNPTTTIWIAPILIAVWILGRTLRNSRALLLTTLITCLYLAFATIWWIQPAGLDITGSLLTPLWQRFLDMLTVGRLTLSEGLFRPSYQPFFSFIIRRFSFVFVGILLVPSSFLLARRVFNFLTRRTRFLSKFDAFSVALALGSLVSTIFLWAGTGGGFGDRTWGLLVPILAVIIVQSITLISERTRLGAFYVVVVAVMVILIPLNFIATNYSESLYQVKPSEYGALNFLSMQNLHNESVFSDNAYVLGVFSYAMPDPSNNIFFSPSHVLNPSTASNASFLMNVRYEWPPNEEWTIFIHSQKTNLLIYSQYGVTIGDFQGFNNTGINRIFDDGEISIYKRSP